MRVYRTLVRLYPRAFRDAYADDLVQLFDDLVAERGHAAAWRICALDLLVTVPRVHVERFMNPTRTTVTLTWTIVLLAACDAASVLTGLYLGALLLVAAAVLGVAQRSALGRALRVPDTALRRRRLRAAAVLAAVFAVSYGVFLATIGDTWTGRETVLAVVGTANMFGSVVCLVTGLLTPRTPGFPTTAT